MDAPTKTELPEKACVITIMFPINTDDEAINIKKQISDILKDTKDKRITFQIAER